MSLIKTLSAISIAALIMLTSHNVLADPVPNVADGLYDSSSVVDTNNNTKSTSTVNSTNTNTNTTAITSTNTNTNNNTNTNTNANTNTNNNTNSSTSTNTNNNVLSGGTTNTNTNNNVVSGGTTNTNTNNNVISGGTTNTNNNNNVNTNTSTVDQTVNSTSNSAIDQTVTSTSDNKNTNTNSNTNKNDSTNKNTNDNNTKVDSKSSNENVNTNNSNITQKVISPPPTAIAPTVNAGGMDTCTTSMSGAVQTQILGLAGGTHVKDLNCERLKNAKTLYNMGMKVAAVSMMCQDAFVWKAMLMAGTPCPFDGMIGEKAKEAWIAHPELTPISVEEEKEFFDAVKSAFMGFGGVALLLLLL
jgi:DNA polymerase III alpha subunit (gram-positive type)